MAKQDITKILGAETVELFRNICDNAIENSAKDSEYQDRVKKSNEIVEKIEALIPDDRRKEFDKLLSDLMMNETQANDVTSLYIQHKTFKVAQQLMVRI